MADMYGNYESVTPGVFKHSEFTFLDEQEKKYTNEDALRQQKQKVYHCRLAVFSWLSGVFFISNFFFDKSYL